MTANSMNHDASGKGNGATDARFGLSFNRSLVYEAVVFVLLVGSGVAVRLACRDLPNFAPVAALALFAGYFFRSALLALSVPLAVMAISDGFLGGYDWYMMALVYGMLALPVAWRGWLRRAFVLRRGGLADAARPLAGLLGCGLLSSLLFFAVTNFGVWLWFGTYEPTLAGLGHCYMAAIPFFRFTLTGDLLFSIVLFGGYALALHRAGVPACGEA